MNVPYIESLPLVPLRAIVPMPYVILSFDLGNQINLSAVDAAVEDDKRIMIVCRKDARSAEVKRNALFDYGCVLQEESDEIL